MLMHTRSVTNFILQREEGKASEFFCDFLYDGFGRSRPGGGRPAEEPGPLGSWKQGRSAACVLDLLPDVVHNILRLLGYVVRGVLDLLDDIVCRILGLFGDLV